MEEVFSPLFRPLKCKDNLVNVNDILSPITFYLSNIFIMNYEFQI